MRLELPLAPEWMFHPDRPCARNNPEDYFPTSRMQRAEARRLCAGCPVASPCLAYALEHREDGVWGGTTAEMRADATKPTRVKCGTSSGYTWHRKHGQEPCDACKEAHAAYQKARYHAGKKVPA